MKHLSTLKQPVPPVTQRTTIRQPESHCSLIKSQKKSDTGTDDGHKETVTHLRNHKLSSRKQKRRVITTISNSPPIRNTPPLPIGPNPTDFQPTPRIINTWVSYPCLAMATTPAPRPLEPIPPQTCSQSHYTITVSLKSPRAQHFACSWRSRARRALKRRRTHRQGPQPPSVKAHRTNSFPKEVKTEAAELDFQHWSL